MSVFGRIKTAHRMAYEEIQVLFCHVYSKVGMLLSFTRSGCSPRATQAEGLRFEGTNSMAYYKRSVSKGDLYHVFARGTGQRIIFEDDEDRFEYCRRMEAGLRGLRGSVYAWCLMGNHVHFVTHMQLDELARFVKKVNGGYARFFNKKHGRSGHLFEARYGSEPIRSDSQLKVAVRYVHRNPIKPNLSRTCDYAWSSYREYTKVPYMTDTEPVLDIFGGLQAFRSFHEDDGLADSGDFCFMDVPDDDMAVGPLHQVMSNDKAVELAKRLIGEASFELLPSLPKNDRDAHLRKLKEAGLPIRQIALITGVGRNAVWAA